MYDPKLDSQRRAVLAGLTLAVLVACSPVPSKDAFAEGRTQQTVGEGVRFGATTRERFRLERGMPQVPRGPESGALAWTTPRGWSELPLTSLRVANFRVGADDRAECYLTTLSGEGGGLDANVNRWRTQMKQPPLTAVEIAALPRRNWFGRPSVWVEIDGTWSGMSGDASGADYRMVGLLLVDPSGSKFLKMIGPRAVILAETEHFKELADSFREGGGPPPSAAASAAEKIPTDKISTDKMPNDAVHAGMPDSMSALGGIAANPGPSAFTWTAPTGWKRGPEKAMREVTFLAGERGEVECYVTALGGDGGGLAANFNRWRQQMGREDLTDAEIAALPTIPMLGGQAKWVEIAREGGAKDLVIGAVCLQPDQSVFVKMLGPKDSVEANRAAFVEFCKSIRSGGG